GRGSQRRELRGTVAVPSRTIKGLQGYSIVADEPPETNTLPVPLLCEVCPVMASGAPEPLVSQTPRSPLPFVMHLVSWLPPPAPRMRMPSPTTASFAVLEAITLPLLERS